MRFELVTYEPQDKDDYVGLLSEAWGSKTLTRPEFEWWFERNPAGSLMSVARMEGRVVGVAAHSLVRMVLGGEERTASFSVHATTHESARGLGIFGALEERHEREATERGVACVLAFSSVRSDATFRRLGWTSIARYRMWARPLVRGGRERRDPLRPHGDAAAGWRNHVVRDATYLGWRYADSPRGYRTIATGDGHVVVGTAPDRSVPTAILADLAGRPRPLLRQAIQAAEGRVLVALPPPEHRSAYASLGFVPIPRSLHFMGKALAGKLDSDPRAWRFTLGDTDFF